MLRMNDGKSVLVVRRWCINWCIENLMSKYKVRSSALQQRWIMTTYFWM